MINVISVNRRDVAKTPCPDSILLKSILDRYRLDRNPVGPISVQYIFK